MRWDLGADRGEPLQVVCDSPRAAVPRLHYEGDVGFDLACLDGATIEPGEYVEIQTGLRLGLPPGTWGLLIARSSTAARGLVVNTVVIDQGYVGPMFVGVTNIGQDVVTVTPGERLAQLVPIGAVVDTAVVVESLPETQRGEKGRGSTGL